MKQTFFTRLQMPSAFLSLSLSLIFNCTALSSPSQTCWKIEQRCGPTGAYTIYLTPQAIKIDVRSSGSTILARAPEWQVNYYNRVTNRIAKCAVKDWGGTPASRLIELYNDSKINTLWKITGRLNYRGYSCVHYDNGGRTTILNGTKTKLSSDEMWCAPNVGSSLPERELLAKFWGCPPFGEGRPTTMTEIPLFISLRKPSDALVEFLTTKSCTQVPAGHIFDPPPKTFKPIANVLQVERGSDELFSPADLHD